MELGDMKFMKDDLHRAVKIGNADRVEWLVNHGFNPNGLDDGKKPAIAYVGAEETPANIAIAKTLYKAGAALTGESLKEKTGEQDVAPFDVTKKRSVEEGVRRATKESIEAKKEEFSKGKTPTAKEKEEMDNQKRINAYLEYRDKYR